MKRLAILFVLLLLGCEAQPEGEIWRFAIEETSGSVQDQYAQRFREMVRERTNGEVLSELT